VDPGEEADVDAEQRHKICRLIAGLVVSDDDLSPEEDAFLDRMLAGFGIPASDRDSIFPILDGAEAAAEMQRLPGPVREEALGMLLRAAVADGKIAPEERAYLGVVGAAIGLSSEALDQRIAETRSSR
jgi:uncharacterized tellurite resistance protein B-like protein